MRTGKIFILASIIGGLVAAPALADRAGGRHGPGGGMMQYRAHSFGSGGMRGGDLRGLRGHGMRSDFGRFRGGDMPRRYMGDRRALYGRDVMQGDVRNRFDGDRKFRRFDRNKFGRFDHDGRRFDRFRHRHGKFVHFHNGWWYDTPWWTVGLAAYPYYDDYAGYADGGDGHTQWCIAHYRSYNPANNTFVSYSGEIRECVSPYGP